MKPVSSTQQTNQDWCKCPTCQQEHVEISLLLQRATPIPCTCQSAIDTTSSVKEIISARAIKSMTEEVAKDLLVQILRRSKLVFDVGLQRRDGDKLVDLRQRITDRQQDAIYLGVLVDEHERVRDVVVTHMDDAGAYPCSNASLRFLKYSLHHP